MLQARGVPSELAQAGKEAATNQGSQLCVAKLGGEGYCIACCCLCSLSFCTGGRKCGLAFRHHCRKFDHLLTLTGAETPQQSHNREFTEQNGLSGKPDK
jgi:hypothetical protein